MSFNALTDLFWLIIGLRRASGVKVDTVPECEGKRMHRLTLLVLDPWSPGADLNNLLEVRFIDSQLA